jgi:hypothetical protein
MMIIYPVAFVVFLLLAEARGLSVPSGGGRQSGTGMIVGSSNNENRLKTFAYYSGRSPNFVVRHQSAEEYLHQEGIVPLNQSRDVLDMKDSSVVCDEAICPKHLSEIELASIPIFLISGAYGTVRRLFAVTVAANFGMKHIKHTKYTTLYLNTDYLGFFKRGTENADELVAWIKREISVTCGSSEKLNMHVSLVLEQVLSYADGYLLQKQNLLNLVELLKRDVADSVRLVVCGDGYTDEKVPDNSNSFLIHCRDDYYYCGKPFQK